MSPKWTPESYAAAEQKSGLYFDATRLKPHILFALPFAPYFVGESSDTGRKIQDRGVA